MNPLEYQPQLINCDITVDTINVEIKSMQVINSGLCVIVSAPLIISHIQLHCVKLQRPYLIATYMLLKLWPYECC